MRFEARLAEGFIRPDQDVVFKIPVPTADMSSLLRRGCALTRDWWLNHARVADCARFGGHWHRARCGGLRRRWRARPAPLPTGRRRSDPSRGPAHSPLLSQAALSNACGPVQVIPQILELELAFEVFDGFLVQVTREREGPLGFTNLHVHARTVLADHRGQSFRPRARTTPTCAPSSDAPAPPSRRETCGARLIWPSAC